MTKIVKQYIAMLLFLSAQVLSSQAQAAVITDYVDPALDNGFLIDFDQFTTGEYLNDFTVGSASFIESREPGSNYFSQSANGIGVSGRMIGLYGEGQIDFDTAIDAFAFSLIGLNAESWVMTALDANGELIEQLNLVKPIGSAAKIFGITATGIRSIELISNTSGANLDVVGMDNFVYARVPVPIPSSLSLFLFALFFLSKKDNKKK